MISLGITNPLAAFVNRQPESINQRRKLHGSAFAPVPRCWARLCEAPASPQAWRSSAHQHEPFPGMETPFERQQKIGMFLVTPFFRQQARQGCLCLKRKALSLKHAFQLKTIFLHLAGLYCMKLR